MTEEKTSAREQEHLNKRVRHMLDEFQVLKTKFAIAWNLLGWMAAGFALFAAKQLWEIAIK